MTEIRVRGPLRFKKRAYAGKNTANTRPLWHRAAAVYDPKELYREFRALCPYVIKDPWLQDVAISRSIRPRGGDLCKRCEKKAKEMEQ